METTKKVIYIAGPITGVKNYWEAFEQAEEDLDGLGYIALSPARLPYGMTNDQYTRICSAMLDSADAVLFLTGWRDSKGARLEGARCEYIGKPAIEYQERDPVTKGKNPRRVIRAWLQNDLEEVFKA